MWNWVLGDSSDDEADVNFFDDFNADSSEDDGNGFDDFMAEDQKKDLLDLQRGRINAFKSQDAETGNFDITFDFSGKLLYAHKIFMTTVSTPMEAWISKRWSNKNDIIKIETYTYEEFYEFLTFLYSGTCDITVDNVFRLIDMAEFFDVAVMKNRCDKRLSKMVPRIDAGTVEEMMDMTQTYSLPNSIDALKYFIRRNMLTIIQSDKFVNFKGSFLDVLFSIYKSTHFEQQLFLSVVKWAENQVSTKEPTLEGADFLDAVKSEFDDMRSKFDFSTMEFDFVIETVASKNFLFSTFDCCKILGECIRKCNQHEIHGERYLKTIFEIVEREVLKEQATAADENFNLQSVMKRELSKILPTVKFRNMKFEVVKEIVVDKAFWFSSRKIYKILAKCQRSDEEKYFKAMFELAENESLKQQNASVDENFDLQNAMKKELSEFLRRVNSKRITFDFVKQFVARSFYSKELYEIIAECQRADEEESELFEMLYELAKKNVETRNLPGEMANLPKAIKKELSVCLPKIRFHKMDEKYLIEFAAKTDLITVEQAKSCFYARVQISNGGKLLIGSFEDILKIRTYQKYRIIPTASGWTFDVVPRSKNKLRFTGLKFDAPSSPSIVQRTRGTEWYLLLEKDGILAVKNQAMIKRNDYLIAELRSTEEFSFALKRNTRLTVSHNTIF